MSTQSPLYLLADRALAGRLEELLLSWADAGASRRVAARLLANELGIVISATTVARWTTELKAARRSTGAAA